MIDLVPSARRWHQSRDLRTSRPGFHLSAYTQHLHLSSRLAAPALFYFFRASFRFVASSPSRFFFFVQIANTIRLLDPLCEQEEVLYLAGPLAGRTVFQDPRLRRVSVESLLQDFCNGGKIGGHYRRSLLWENMQPGLFSNFARKTAWTEIFHLYNATQNRYCIQHVYTGANLNYAFLTCPFKFLNKGANKTWHVSCKCSS